MSSNICRLCLKIETNMVHSFESIYNEYVELFPTDVLNTSSIAMFDSVCFVCYALVKRFHVFSHACKQTQQYLEEFTSGHLDELPKSTPVIKLELKRCEITSWICSDENETTTERVKPEVSPDHWESNVLMSSAALESDQLKVEFKGVDACHNDTDDAWFTDEQNLEDTNVPEQVQTRKLKNKTTQKKTRKKRKDVIKDPNAPLKIVPFMKFDTEKYYVKVLTEEERQAEFNSRKCDKDYIDSEYKCKLCYKWFYSKFLYEGHIQDRHIKNKPTDVQCNLCKEYHTFRALRRHLRTHTYRIYCKRCDYSVSTLNSFERHFESKHMNNQHICDVCGKNFRTKASVALHYSRTHTAEGSFTCDYCQGVYRHKASLALHIRLHMYGYKCTKCCNKFMSQKSLRDHACNYLKRLMKRQRRELEVKGENEKSKRGRHKSNGSSDKLALSKDSEEPAYCVECDKQFKNQYYLQFHFKRSKKHGVPPLSKCKYCNQKFPNWIKMQLHVDSVHLMRTYKCQLCQATLANAALYASHKRQHKFPKETRERKFECNICSFKFYEKGTLKKHMLIHSAGGMRNFKCNQCDKTFTTQINMYSHVRVVHMGYRKKKSKVKLESQQYVNKINMV